MSGGWIVWIKGLPQKIEVLRIADMLKIDQYRAACGCMAVWEWADENTTDGRVPGINLTMLDQAVHLSLPGFAAAMVAVGWLQVDDDGLTFPNWHRHNLRSAKARYQARERKRRQRSREPGMTNP